DGEAGQVAALRQLGEGAHPVAAGEQQRLDALEVDRDTRQGADAEQRLDGYLDAALAQRVGQGPPVLLGPPAQPLDPSLGHGPPEALRGAARPILGDKRFMSRSVTEDLSRRRERRLARPAP